MKQFKNRISWIVELNNILKHIIGLGSSVTITHNLLVIWRKAIWVPQTLTLQGWRKSDKENEVAPISFLDSLAQLLLEQLMKKNENERRKEEIK